MLLLVCSGFSYLLVTGVDNTTMDYSTLVEVSQSSKGHSLWIHLAMMYDLQKGMGMHQHHVLL